ncbi:MAG: AAA family ATPase [Gammaproteobacteria bacterium]|nr:AAA family ATPase [Gammaproteobacteria bacterium]MCY4275730.1 AAA family ATPase [Gammaproteobacteria bacterium]
MERRALPIGIQTFSTLHEEGCYYVDKTPLIRELIRSGRHYFLSRPRRFGKSLLVDTLQELFEGNENLFRGLDIHPYWDWSVQYPVVRLSFGGDIDTPDEIQNHVLNQLYRIEQEYDLKTFPSVRTAPERLENVLYFLHQTIGKQVVVLVDEYDRPILNVLEDHEKARVNRNQLRNLYSILKDAQKHIRFVFVTGITMMSMNSFSSGLNNLDDISLYPPLASICGYTDHDLDMVFAPELEGLDRDKIRTWYNGYHWLGTEKLYNPHDILHLFKKREFRAHWFKSREPGYLYRLLKENRVSPMQLENRVLDADFVTNFELGEFSHEALLLQSGYLTIKEQEEKDTRILYHLDYPDFEVQTSFNAGLAEHLTKRGREVAATGEDLIKALGENNFSVFMEKIQDLLAEFPHAGYDTANLGDYESWYASLLSMSFRTTRVTVTAEEMTSHGRSDLGILHENQVFVLEFKMVRDSKNREQKVEKGLDEAITQIRTKGYAEKYLDLNQPIHLIGMVFGEEDRNLLEIRVEML